MKTPPHIRCIRLQRRKGGIPKIAGGIGPVSYTHLDVYKRQEYDEETVGLPYEHPHRAGDFSECFQGGLL